MEIKNNYPNFIPIRVASNYYHKWDSDVRMKSQMNTYFKCLEGQCQIELKNNCSYQGEIKNGKYEGKGLFVWKNGVTYQGNFKNSQITGYGKIIWPNGSYYQGQLLRGEQNGIGTFYSSTESFKYIGQWKQGKKQGKGKIQYKDQSTFEGNFKNDKKNGYGKMVYPSKNQYQGEWFNDKKDGKGTMNWYSGHEKYIGQWKNGLQDGYGQYYWLENRTQYKIFKNVYKGYWKKGKRQGFGAFFYSNGYRFEGYFFENLKEGCGISIDDQGVARTHVYKNNRLTEIRAKNLPIKNQNLIKQSKQVKKLQDEQDSKLPLLSKKQQKNDGQTSIDQASKTNYSQSSHKISDNEYKKYLDFEHPQINENFYNMLLRLNSRFRYLYKTIGTSNINVKDCYSGMVLENYWKSLRECRLLNQNLSLVAVSREFNRGTKCNFSMGLPEEKILEIVKQQKYNFEVVPYQDILWYDYFSKVDEHTSLRWNQFSFNCKYQFSLRQKRSSATIDIHNSLNLVLFRHFICLIIHTAMLFDQSTQKTLKQKVQNLLNILQHSNDANSKNERAQIQDSTTQITRSLTVPQWVKSIHEEIVYELEKPKQNFMKKLDVSVPVRRMYSLLEYCNIFKDLNEKIIYLQRIQRYLNIRNSPLKKEYRSFMTDIDKSLKLNPAFGYLMNYEMNLKQINQFLFLCISRKILASSQEQFQNKYQQIVKNMLNFIKAQKQKTLVSAFNDQRGANQAGIKARRTPSWKDRKREQLLIEAEKQKKKKKEQEEQKKQLQREKIERQEMMKQDFDIEDLVCQSEASDDYFG